MSETNLQQPPNASTNTQKNVDIIINPILWNQWNLEAEERAKSSNIAIMPSLDHFTYQDYDNFYEPSDDTYLFLDALQYEFSKLCKHHHNDDDENDYDNFVLNSSIPTTFCHDESSSSSSSSSSSPHIVCLEVGCGSGVVTVYLQKQWMLLSQETNNRNPQHLDEPLTLARKQKSFRRMYNIVTDINPLALKATQSTFVNNHNQDSDDTKSTLLECIQCDLATSILPQLRHSCNIVLFNPPYVPTPDEEVNQNGSIVASWAGGINGRRVIDRFMPQLVQLLSKKETTSNDGIDCNDGGIAYMVTVDDNQPYELATLLLGQHQLLMKPLYRRRARNEYLTIQKITWI